MEFFELVKRRTEQFGGFFKSILVPRDSNSNYAETANLNIPGRSKVPQLTEDIYDDTESSENNADKVWDWSDQRHVPTLKPGAETTRGRGSSVPSERPLFPAGPGGNMLDRVMEGMFESVFGMMEQQFESAIKDMDAAFGQIDGFMDEEDDDRRYSRFFGQGFPLEELENAREADDSESKNSINPEANYRDIVLKSDDKKAAASTGPRTSPFQKNWNWSTESSTIQTYSYDNGKVESQVIKETPEGREIITQRQNGQGVMEEYREFIPRKDLPPDQSIFTKIFRPKF